ncbi:MAG: WD40 repeat domain-containing protein [Cyanophyceae cyanobacterium]
MAGRRWTQRPASRSQSPERLLPSLLGLAAATAVVCGWVEAASAQVSPPQPPDSTPLPTANPAASAQRGTNPQLLYSMEAHETAVDSLAFSPDGEVLVSGGSFNDPTVVFWSVENGKKLDRLRAQREAVLTLAFSPDGNLLVSSGSDGGINLWNWQTGEFQASFLENASNILSLAITPDSEVLVSGGLDGIKVWDLIPQRPLYTLASYGLPVYSLAMNPNGYIFASGDNSGRVIFWNLRTGTIISEFSAHTESIRGLVYTPDGNRLITGSNDRTVKVWDLLSGQLLYTFTGHTGPIRGLVLNPDGETLASASNDGVRLWNIRTGEPLSWLPNDDWVESVAFSPDGRLLASGAFNRTINVWQLDAVTSEQ